MLQEIREQPEVLRHLVSTSDMQALRDEMHARGVEAVSISARGTSDNAATLAKYIFEIAAGVPVSLVASSVFTLYNAKMDLSKWLLLGISQSGESTDVVEVMSQAKGMGALVAGITNVENSSMTRAGDYTFLCHAGEEKSVAATKTYTATLGVLYLLAGALAKDPTIAESLHGVADAMQEVFSLEEQIARVVERYRYMEECVVLARGINQATCLEAALKLTETCYVVAKPYSAADFQHGPIATAHEGFPIFLYAPPGKGYPAMVEIAEKLAERGAELIVVSSEEEILSHAATPIRVPVTVDEIYSPLVYIIVGQLFAQCLSLAKGNNPDAPRGLCKVTKTL
ncbi:MAG: SIS domain-containing protein [Armatimonadota bacterium]